MRVGLDISMKHIFSEREKKERKNKVQHQNNVERENELLDKKHFIWHCVILNSYHKKHYVLFYYSLGKKEFFFTFY